MVLQHGKRHSKLDRLTIIREIDRLETELLCSNQQIARLKTAVLRILVDEQTVISEKNPTNEDFVAKYGHPGLPIGKQDSLLRSSSQRRFLD